MKKALDVIERILAFAITTLFAVLIVPVTLQILARYVDFIPRYIWTEEVARFCFIWIIMIGAMIAVRHDQHFDVDLLPPASTPQGAAWGRLVVHVAMAVLAASFIYFGKGFLDQGLMQSSEIADLPMATIYIAWPLSGVIWMLFLLEKLIADIAIIRSGPDGEAHS